MSRWIDADKLQRHGQRGGLVHWKDIAEAPSIDLVRCKECEYSDIYKGEMFCRIHTDDVKADDFCSYGERKSKGADDD